MHLTPADIARLSPDERLALISELWESLDHDRVALTSEQRDELDRRLAALDADRAASVPWESLKAELEQRSP